MRDHSTSILATRLAVLAAVVAYSALSFYDLIVLSRPNFVATLYQLLFGIAALASEALPLTAETSVYPLLPLMKSLKGRFALYTIISLPLLTSSASGSSRLSGYSLAYFHLSVQWLGLRSGLYSIYYYRPLCNEMKGDMMLHSQFPLSALLS